MLYNVMPAGTIRTSQEDHADPQGGIGMPAERLFRRPLWASPGLQGTPNNLPPAGDRVQPRGPTPIGRTGPGSSPAPSPNAQALPPTVLVRERHRYANVIETPLNVETVSRTVLQQPTGLRQYLTLSNRSPGSQVLFVAFGTQASLLSSLSLQPGQAILFDAVVPQNEVFAISDTAGGILTVAYAQYAPL